MAAGTVGGQTGQDTMITTRVLGGKTAMTRSAAPATTVASGRSSQRTVGLVAGSAGRMGLRISRVYRIATGRMTTGALGRHRYPDGVVDIGVVLGKARMAGSAVPTAVSAA